MAGKAATTATVKPPLFTTTTTTSATGSKATGAAATSGPLTPGLAQFRFKSTAKAPAKTTKPAAKAKPKAGTAEIETVTTGKKVPVTTRLAVLRFIAAMKGTKKATGYGTIPGHAIKTTGTTAKIETAVGGTGRLMGNTANPSGKTNIGTPLVANVKGKSVVLTTAVQQAINQIGRHVLKDDKFTIANAPQHTAAEWNEIVKAASTRVHEMTLTTETAKAAQPGTTGTVTGQALYTAWLATYNSGAKGATPTTKNKTNKEVWDQRFYQMGILNNQTPDPAQAQTAYKEVLAKAQQGDTTASKVIQTQIKTQAKTLATAQQALGTAQSGATYFLSKFQTIAHAYLVPMNAGTLNQYAATAAKNAGDTYYARENAITQFKETVQKQAASLYSSYATEINKGVTTRTLLSPYAEVAAKTLGYNTASTAMSQMGITWMSPKWNPALSGGKSATGKLAAPMSLTQWRQHLITTPQYGWANTATGQQTKLNVGQELAQLFGLRKL